MSHLLMTAQRHNGVSSESQDFLLNLRNLTGTRRGSTSFIDILQRRAHWQTHSKPVPQPVCIGLKPHQGEPVKESVSPSAFDDSPLQNNRLIESISSTDPKLHTHGCNPQNDPLIHNKIFMHRHSLAPPCCPHYCKAGLALLLTAGEDRASLEHSPSSCHSLVHLNQTLISGLHPLGLGHSVEPTSVTPSEPSHKPITSSSSIHQTVQCTVHNSSPSSEHRSHSCSGQIPIKSLLPKSDISTDILTPSESPMSPASPQNLSSFSSTDLTLPRSHSSLRLPLFPMAAQSCTRKDRDLSHLNDCLHRIISRRTSFPVLMDGTARQPGSSHGNVNVYDLPVNNIQNLGPSSTTQHKAPEAPLSMVWSKVGQDFMVCQKTVLNPRRHVSYTGPEPFITPHLMLLCLIKHKASPFKYFKMFQYSFGFSTLPLQCLPPQPSTSPVNRMEQGKLPFTALFL